jgi:hypothetical protein
MRIHSGLVLLALAVPCFSQVLVEHSAAAAGGALGALAGKAVSDGLGATLTTVKKAAADKPVKVPKDSAKKKDWSDGDANRAKPPISTPSAGSSGSSFPVFGPATASAGMPASSGGVTRQNRPIRSNAASLEPESASAPAFVPVPAPIVHHASREEVAAIQAGTPRSDVIAKLGPPASLVTIPDEGHLLETLKYVSANSWVGTVRIDNGSVVRVDSPQQ